MKLINGVLILFLIFSCRNEDKKNTIELEGMTFKCIEPGAYELHDLKEVSPEGNSDSEPRFVLRQVNITKRIYIATTELTFSQYNKLSKNKSAFESSNLPISNISPADMLNFIAGANEGLQKYKLRLPTEDEWTIAYRYLNKNDGYYWSDNNDLGLSDADDYVWYYHNTTRPMPVGQKKPNKLGLYDMNGNVAEVCVIGDKFITKGGGIGKYNHVVSSAIFFLPNSSGDIGLMEKSNEIGLRLVLEIQ